MSVMKYISFICCRSYRWEGQSRLSLSLLLLSLPVLCRSRHAVPLKAKQTCSAHKRRRLISDRAPASERHRSILLFSVSPFLLVVSLPFPILVFGNCLLVIVVVVVVRGREQSD